MTEHHGHSTITATSERDGAVEVVSLDRPERMNGITQTMVDELGAYFRAKTTDTTTRVIVLRGEGRAFCAGLDIKEQQAGGDRPVFAEGRVSLSDLPVLIHSAPQVVIALLHGGVSGGGFAEALRAFVEKRPPVFRPLG